MRILSVALLLVLLTAPAGSAVAQQQYGEEIAAKETELEQLRTQIREARDRADALADDEKKQVERLHALEREASLTEDLLGRLAVKEDELQVQVEGLQLDIATTQERIVTRRQRLGERLRAMYMRPRNDVIVAALTSDDLQELTTRVKALTHVARTERALIGEVQQDQADLRARRGALAEQIAEIHLTRSEAEDRKAQLGRLKNERQVALTSVREERALFEASVAEMEEAAEAMERLIADLERKRAERRTPLMPSTGFAQRQGLLPWPVDGPVLKPYGRSVHPQFKTVVMNKGLNIGAAMGTPIQSVADGVVEYVNWLPGYGKCIIVNHGDGYYTLYAHAAAIFPGEGARVQAGEVLGEVGDTGSLNGSQLYFEIRKGKDSLDPSSWLSRS